jgi:hypothetical protein
LLGVLLVAAAPAAVPTSSILGVFDARKSALAQLGQHEPQSIEMTGTLNGYALDGTFHSWHDGESDRFVQELGVRDEQTLRVGDREYAIDSSGDVRELRGLLSQRQKTEDFIDSGEFLNRPQYSTLIGPAALPDGRAVVQVLVQPPGGEAETVSLDARTSMIDRLSFADDDGTSTVDFYDYRAVHGALVAYKRVDSNGDHAYDVTETTTDVRVDKPIPATVFAVPASVQIQTDRPITVPLARRAGHYYAQVTIHGHDYQFLVDTGAQGVVIDSRVAAELVLMPAGRLEVSGATRTGGLGIAPLGSIGIGSARLPVRVVSVLDLNSATNGAFPIDGILGYPFFAESEVRIDPDRLTMTIGKPGSLPALGAKFDVDVDRQLAEISGTIDGVTGRFVVDTGNSTELLVFQPFLRKHVGLISYAGHSQIPNFGIGGSMNAVGAIVNELDLGPFRFFNRNANMMLTSSGAFADKFDAGNIGMGTMQNFISTFDLANNALYFERGAGFDDGRYRPVTE